VNLRRSVTWLAIILIILIMSAARPLIAASDLMLAPDLSFTDDSSSNFPITGKDLSQGAIAIGRPTLIFFGTSHCWNTNREAERVVALYPKYRGRVHFVVVDLNAASPEQRRLVSRYYRGYIPTLALFNARGELIYDQAGETAAARGDTAGLEKLLRKAR
jgi:hypothetical protein